MALSSVLLKIIVEMKSFNFQVSLLPALKVVFFYSEQGYTSSIVLQVVTSHTFHEFKEIVVLKVISWGEIWYKVSRSTEAMSFNINMCRSNAVY